MTITSHIQYDTYDYNVIFNDMVLIKWKKNMFSYLKLHYKKNGKRYSYHDFNYYP
jgi:hypothetical protein